MAAKKNLPKNENPGNNKSSPELKTIATSVKKTNDILLKQLDYQQDSDEKKRIHAKNAKAPKEKKITLSLPKISEKTKGFFGFLGGILKGGIRKILAPFDFIKGIIGKVGDVVSGFFKAIKGFFSLFAKIGEAIGKVIEGIAKGLGSIFKAIGKLGSAIAKIGKGVGSAIRSIMTGLTEGLIALAGALAVFAAPPVIIGMIAITAAIIGLAAALRIATPAIKVIADLIQNVVIKAIETIGDVLKSFVPVFMNVINTVGDVLKSFIPVFVNAFKVLGDIAKTYIKAISDAIAVIGEIAKKLIGTVGKIIISFFKFLLDFFKELKGIKLSDLAALYGLAGAFTAISASMVVMTAAMLPFAAATKLFKKISGGANGVLSPIKDIIDYIVGEFKEKDLKVASKNSKNIYLTLNNIGKALSDVAKITAFAVGSKVAKFFHVDLKKTVDEALNTVTAILKGSVKNLSSVSINPTDIKNVSVIIGYVKEILTSVGDLGTFFKKGVAGSIISIFTGNKDDPMTKTIKSADSALLAMVNLFNTGSSLIKLIGVVNTSKVSQKDVKNISTIVGYVKNILTSIHDLGGLFKKGFMESFGDFVGGEKKSPIDKAIAASQSALTSMRSLFKKGSPLLTLIADVSKIEINDAGIKKLSKLVNVLTKTLKVFSAFKDIAKVATKSIGSVNKIVKNPQIFRNMKKVLFGISDVLVGKDEKGMMSFSTFADGLNKNVMSKISSLTEIETFTKKLSGIIKNINKMKLNSKDFTNKVKAIKKAMSTMNTELSDSNIKVENNVSGADNNPLLNATKLTNRLLYDQNTILSGMSMGGGNSNHTTNEGDTIVNYQNSSAAKDFDENLMLMEK